MPATYVIDQDAGLVFSRAWGTLNDADLYSNRDAMRADPAFSAELSQLWDFSGVEHLEITGEGLRALAMDVSLFANTSRRAVIVTSDASFGMARMFLLARDPGKGGEIRLFRDRESAVTWLSSPQG